MNIIRTLLATALLSASAFAFGQSNEAMTVTIPFAFQVAGKALPAGHYLVVSTSSDTVLDLREIKGPHGTFLTGLPVGSSQAREKSTLVFARNGDQYRLAQVNYGNAGMSYHLRQSKSRYGSEAPPEIATLVADPR
jgi:hypothetical protein